jgi:hypothetical protein
MSIDSGVRGEEIAMAQPRKEGLETLGLRLHKAAILKVKMIALERGKTASEIATEALSQWWAQQPESKTRGPLFPGVAPVVASSPSAIPSAKEKP